MKEATVTVVCPTCGVESTIRVSSYNKRKNKDTCSHCVKHARKDIEFVRKAFAERGYTLLTTEYKNAHQHLDYVCDLHPDKVQRIIYNSLQRGCGCYYCGLKKRGDARALTMEKVLEEVGKTKYTFAEGDLSNGSKSLLTLWCPDHSSHFNIVYNGLQQGGGCQLCARDAISGSNSFHYKGFTIYPSQYVRSYLVEWKQQAAKEAGYRCEISNLEKALTDFDIHHTESSTELMRDIAEDVYGCDLTKPLSKEDIDMFMPEYIEAHSKIKGAFISHSVHKLYHAMYGMRKITLGKYNEFKSDFEKGWIVFDKHCSNRKPKKSERKARRLNDTCKESSERNN